ncbi:hypothetical protein HanPI659440_Chr13g0496581 [Helianthus annuus]|nr:hypothetical protein HanPI659440_Chr13g0496581 [Helianthus annuus]
MDSYSYGCKWKPRKVSAKRDFPDQFYDENQCVKKHKGCESKEDSFIPLDTELESESESVYSENCGSGTRGSVYDIIPRIVNVATCDSDEGIKELGVYNEVRIHGACLKEIRWYETEDGLKIEFSVEKLKKKKKKKKKKKGVDDGLFGRACESVGDNVTNESVSEEVCSRRRRRVAAVRSYPPGCGRVMKIA